MGGRNGKNCKVKWPTCVPVFLLKAWWHKNEPIMPIVSDTAYPDFATSVRFILDMVYNLNRRPSNDGMNPSWESKNIEQEYLWINVAWKSFLTCLCIESKRTGLLWKVDNSNGFHKKGRGDF